MSYFSRLTDIVTCNIGDMLRREDDPKGAIRRIIEEMEEGLGGARRSVATATASEAGSELVIIVHSDWAYATETVAPYCRCRRSTSEGGTLVPPSPIVRTRARASSMPGTSSNA